MAYAAARSSALGAMGLWVLGCLGDPIMLESDTEMGSATTTATSTMTALGSSGSVDSTTTGGGTGGSMSSADTAASSGGPGTNSSGEPGTSSGEPGTSSGSTGGSAFQFAPNDPGDYTPIDRVGFVADSTLLVLLGDKDAYNIGTPDDDAALAFLPDFAESLDTWHYGVPGMQTPDNTGIADDLTAFALTPCAPPQEPMPTCLEQIGPVALPDVVGLDLTSPPVFPNGRLLEDPVMDILLAVIWLDLSVHDVTRFIDLDDDGVPGPSLNPLTNDVPFMGGFPYLAPPH